MNDTHPASLQRDTLARLIEHRDRLDRDVQDAYSELLDILALGNRTGDSVFAQATRILRKEARVPVVDTAITLIRDGATGDETAHYLARAFETDEPVPQAELARLVTREGYRHELNALEAFLHPTAP